MRKSIALLFIATLLVATLPTQVAANPLVPGCLGTPTGGHSVLADTITPELCEQIAGRVFPEASLLSTSTGQLPATDFISFYEFQAGIEYLNAQYPDFVEIHVVAQSYGLPDTTGAMHSSPIYIVELTNEKSPVPMEERQELLFMLSIHGNEKGGREGGFRVLEDLAKGIGFAAETVQDGSGLPSAIEKPGGGQVTTYHDYLDFQRVFLLFPNVDGWIHDEAEFIHTPCPGYLPTLFCRTNGAGTDLNRQMPTIGWQLVNEGAGRLAMNEPEAQGYNNWLIENHTFDYAIDIHGMLNHENFAAIMMPAGSFSPQEMYRSTRLAQTLKERLNEDPHFSTWTSAWQAAETAAALAEGATCDMVDFCNIVGTAAVGSSDFAEWSTVWDAIGYTDSGFSGDFFAQTTGLNAPGYDIELAYNHITVDSQYEAAALFNDYHVKVVREIVKSFMDSAALDPQISYDAAGTRSLYVESSYVATNLDDESLVPGGWATENPTDDAWEYSESNPFTARPAKYFEDIRPFLRDGDAPGVLNPESASRITSGILANYDNVIVAGSAINDLVGGNAGSNEFAEGANTPQIQALLEWVENGGNLILTDAALNFFDASGLTEGAVDVAYQYAGASNLDRAHALAVDVRGAARQTYEPVPLGFAVGNNAPSWYIDAGKFASIGGDVAGTGLASEDHVNLGRVDVGAGQIQFIGALLPDPTEEFYHPYGLDDYATTSTGNQILRNMLGWSQSTVDPAIVIQDDGTVVQTDNERVLDDSDADTADHGADEKDTPVVGLLPIGVLLAALVAMRRRN